MSLIMKIDVKARFVSRGAVGQNAVRPASLPLVARFSGIEAAVARANTAEFVDDFTLEHSSPDGSVAPDAIAGESGGKQGPEVPESPQA